MTKVRTCENQQLNEIKDNLPSNDELQTLADFFKHFSEFSRIKILAALYGNELCVCDLVDIVGMNQPAVSHQLRILKTGKIIKARKDGKHVFYSLDDDHVDELIRDGFEHIRGECSPEK